MNDSSTPETPTDRRGRRRRSRRAPPTTRPSPPPPRLGRRRRPRADGRGRRRAPAAEPVAQEDGAHAEPPDRAGRDERRADPPRPRPAAKASDGRRRRASDEGGARSEVRSASSAAPTSARCASTTRTTSSSPTSRARAAACSRPTARQLVGERGTLFGVCDGMGGAAAGEVASQLAVDIIYERMADRRRRPKHRDELARRLVRAVEAAGLRIFRRRSSTARAAAWARPSTVAALVDDHLFLAQVGDCARYILRGDRLVQVTRDQSLVNQLIEAGQLTEEEAETFEHNNIILQALGTADTVQVDLTYVRAAPRRHAAALLRRPLRAWCASTRSARCSASVDEPLEACKIAHRARQPGRRARQHHRHRREVRRPRRSSTPTPGGRRRPALPEVPAPRAAAAEHADDPRAEPQGEGSPPVQGLRRALRRAAGRAPTSRCATSGSDVLYGEDEKSPARRAATRRTGRTTRSRSRPTGRRSGSWS